MFFDLHRHDEASSFDGFGKPAENAKQAKKLGYRALGIANHGNTHTHIQHYFACKEEGIKPILGVEGYFLPKHKEKHRGYHLCVFAKNVKGFSNLNKLHTEGEKQKYYNAILDFDILEKYSEGLIVTNACIASYISQALVKGNKQMAIKAAKKFKSIFGDDFYFEIQPYAISDPFVQERLNYDLYMLGKKLDIKCILTSDSHYTKKEDFPTYLKLHEMGGHDFFDIEATYESRYMPSQGEIVQRFLDMHDSKRNNNADWSIPNAAQFARKMYMNLDKLQKKVDGDILEKLDSGLPVFDKTKDSKKQIIKDAINGLKKRGKHNKKYVNRLKEEMDVIFYHHLEDYFLMVADYVTWAKDQGIVVGPGRGSGCNSLVNYALHITDVDPILFKLDFSRFLGKDKKGMPDIDVDFERDRRDEVIEYILGKYPNNSAQVCSYGMYQIDNLVNDLAKVSGMAEEKEEISNTKKLIRRFQEDDLIKFDELMESSEGKRLNTMYDDILIHFSKLYHKMRFVGTHAAGVAITKGNILNYTALRLDKKSGRYFTNFDMNDLEKIGVEKFDVLGLVTMSAISELREMTGHKKFDEKWVYDKKILDAFNEGDTDGIFQFDKQSVQDLLAHIGVHSFEDIVAASAMNRPGPLMLDMPDQYKYYKENPEVVADDKPYSKYLQETYGSLIYQEQILAIATNIGGMEMKDARVILKMAPSGTVAAVEKYNRDYPKFLKIFNKGAYKHGLTKEETEKLFDSFFTYSFNKGHSVGYSLISVEEMYYKVYYPTHYWYVKMKYAPNDSLRGKFKANAVAENVLIFLPHVNYSADDTLRKVEGEWVIQEGLLAIKGIGKKAAEHIEMIKNKDGVYISRDDFLDRARNRAVHKGVISKLDEYGALDFNKKSYIERIKRYNSALYARA